LLPDPKVYIYVLTLSWSMSSLKHTKLVLTLGLLHFSSVWKKYFSSR
jgi:hypothetical protein